MRILSDGGPDHGTVLPSLERRAAGGWREGGFLEATGERAALLGGEDGRFEFWAWPLCLLRDLELVVQPRGAREPLAGAQLERGLRVEPDGFALTYRHKKLSLTLEAFVPRDRTAALLVIELPARERPAIELRLRPLFRPMWPAGLGGQVFGVDEESGAILLTEEIGRFAALVGSDAAEPLAPSADSVAAHAERGGEHGSLALRLAPRKGKSRVVVAIAAAQVEPPPLTPEARLGGAQSAVGTARASRAIAAARELLAELLREWPALREASRAHWREQLGRHARLSCSDPEHERAFLWAQVAIERAWTEVEGVGRGLVAGLAPGGSSLRPGYGWFFGGDAFAASRALSASGDFDGAREVFRFAAAKQRADGKLMHELTLSAGLCDWLGDYPYAYYKGQTTPGFVACLDHYLCASGDLELARELWPNVERAIAWCAGTTDREGRMQVPRAGIAAVEAGPLAGRIESEIYLQGIWISALRGAERIAHALGHEDELPRLRELAERAEHGLETFWRPELGRYGFAHLRDGTTCDDLTAYLALPLARGQGDARRGAASAAQLSDPALLADWGARMFSCEAAIYAPEHYNIGSVFPYLTGFVLLAQYRHGQTTSAFQVLDSQVGLCDFGGLGLIPEHLEGERARCPARSVPHQVFSSAAIVQGIAYGLFGLAPDALGGRLAIHSTLPPHWEHARLERLRVGDALLTVELRRERGPRATRLVLALRHDLGAPLQIEWRPRLPPLSRLRAARRGAEVLEAAARALPGDAALEVLLPALRVAAGERLELELEAALGPELALAGKPLERGAASRGLRFGPLELAAGKCTWRLSGPAGSLARVPFACDREVALEGARFHKGSLEIELPDGEEGAYTTREVELRLLEDGA